MSALEVIHVLEVLENSGCRVWVAGGWGVDALVGNQTRAHRDLDLALDMVGESAAIETLSRSGYGIETDWRPVRIELAAPGDRWVDLHPVVFGTDGDGAQADVDGGSFAYPKGCFATGVVAGQLVPCLSIEQQFRFHAGYEPRDVDLADLRLLHALRPQA
jgi:lincosamide nucleotidyltransferase A/C/D/E